MTKNPVLNALVAEGYILLVVLVMTYAEGHFKAEKSVLIPMAVISMFTLSAAVMAYVFGYRPFVMYFEGKKKEAVKLFLQTVMAFGAITVVVFGLVFSGVMF